MKSQNDLFAVLMKFNYGQWKFVRLQIAVKSTHKGKKPPKPSHCIWLRRKDLICLDLICGKPTLTEIGIPHYLHSKANPNLNPNLPVTSYRLDNSNSCYERFQFCNNCLDKILEIKLTTLSHVLPKQMDSAAKGEHQIDALKCFGWTSNLTCMH